ncbi:MAG: response regulator [Nitrosopumilales archaeon]|nr:MAG: response regulator [Nitrosopumilales archaeon]
MILSMIMKLAAKHNRRPLKVMIIEDEQDILLLYKDYLINRGHQVLVTSTSASEITSDYDKVKPDITIIDYKLPGKKDGIQAAAQIYSKYPSAAILIVTAYDTVIDEVSKNTIFENKNFNILIKPVKLFILESEMYKVLNSN